VVQISAGYPDNQGREGVVSSVLEGMPSVDLIAYLQAEGTRAHSARLFRAEVPGLIRSIRLFGIVQDVVEKTICALAAPGARRLDVIGPRAVWPKIQGFCQQPA